MNKHLQVVAAGAETINKYREKNRRHRIKCIRMPLLATIGLLFIIGVGCQLPDEQPSDNETPGDVDLLSAIAGDAAVALSWWDPYSGTDHVEISCSPGGNPPETCMAGVETHTIAGLTNGIEYTLTVKTVDNSGNASIGVTVSATPAFQRMFGGNNDDAAYSISKTSDGGYVVAGYSESTDLPFLINHGESDCYIVKLDSNGNLEWQKLHGSVNDDVAHSIQQTDDGGYIVAGYWEVIAGDEDDYYVLKLNASGNRSWERACGGGSYDKAYACQQTTDGGYIVGGISYSSDIPGLTNSGKSDCYIVKLFSDGVTSWEVMFGGNGIDSAFSLELTDDGGYVIAGITESTDIPGFTHKGFGDFYVAKLDSSGNLSWQKMFGGNGMDYIFSIQQTADGGYVAAGRTGSTDIPGLPNSGSNGYVVKLDSNGDISWQKIIDTGAILSIKQTSGGGYVVAGRTSGSVLGMPSAQYHIMELEANGNTSWEKTYGGSDDDYPDSILTIAGGGYIVAGYSSSTDIPGATNNGGTDCYIIKLD